MAKFRCGVRYTPPNLRKLGYEEDIYLFATRDRHKPGLFLGHTREWVRVNGYGSIWKGGC